MVIAQKNLPGYLGEQSIRTANLEWDKIVQWIFEEPVETRGFTIDTGFEICAKVGIKTKDQAAQFQELGCWCLDYAYTHSCVNNGSEKAGIKISYSHSRPRFEHSCEPDLYSCQQV